jgi:cytochrome c biogenesis protein
MIKILLFFRSTKLALVLIAFLALYAALSGDRIAFRAPLFLVPLAFFTLNLFFCTVHRIAAEASGRRSWKPGPDLVHAALLLFIAAGIVSLFGRWEGQVILAPGEAVNLNENSLILLEDFRVERYDDGSIRSWVSQVSLIGADDGELSDRRTYG